MFNRWNYLAAVIAGFAIFVPMFAFGLTAKAYTQHDVEIEFFQSFPENNLDVYTVVGPTVCAMAEDVEATYDTPHVTTASVVDPKNPDRIVMMSYYGVKKKSVGPGWEIMEAWQLSDESDESCLTYIFAPLSQS